MPDVVKCYLFGDFGILLVRIFSGDVIRGQIKLLLLSMPASSYTEFLHAHNFGHKLANFGHKYGNFATIAMVLGPELHLFQPTHHTLF